MAKDAPRLAMAPDGTAVAAWSIKRDGHTVIEASTRAPGAAFTAPVVLTHGEDAAELELAAARGGAVAIWAEQDAAAAWHVTASAWTPAGGWESPRTISPPTTVFPVPHVAIADTGEMVAIWTRTPLRTSVIEGTRRLPGQDWGGVENISDSTHEVRAAALVMDEAGNATAAWIEPPSSSTFRGAVTWSEKRVGAAWTTPAAPTDNVEPTDYVALATGHGRTAMAWSSWQLFTARASSRDGAGAWSPSTVIGPVVNYATPPSTAIDGLGGIASTWPAGQFLLNRQPAGGSWLASPESVGGSGFLEVNYSQLAAGPRGELLVVMDGWGLGSVDRIQARTRDANGTWGVPQDLAAGDARLPQVAMDDQGNGLVVWVQRNVGGIIARAYDSAGPDVRDLNIPYAATAGAVAAMTVSARDRWSALRDVVWDFGDGTTATGGAVEHTYRGPGRYHVTVTATDVLGNSTSGGEDVVVSPAPVQAPAQPAPTDDPTPAASTPAPVRATAPEKLLSIRFSRSYKTPGLSRRKVCRGRVTMKLQAGRKVLAKATDQLDRRCQFNATFKVRREALAGRRKLTVVAHFQGNRYLGPTTNSFKITIDG
ncbi:MAG TPA: PKD domain-containing protein [Solirubrobacter sp.]